MVREVEFSGYDDSHDSLIANDLYYYEEDGEVLVNEEAALARLKWFGSEGKGLAISEIEEVAARLKLSPEAIRTRLDLLGYAILEDEAEADQYNASRRATKKANLGRQVRDTSETQYGVLQPAANLGAGCLNMWLWLGLIFLVIAGVVAVLSPLMG